MAEETTISTPVDNSTSADTSSSVEPASTGSDTTVGNAAADTSTQEPVITETTAETGTQTGTQTEILYAGKYKTIEELEKGYKEAEKSFNKASEFEKKYNELLQQKEKETAQQQQQALLHAQQRGFDSIEQQQITDYLNDVEFKEYWNYAGVLPSEAIGQVQQYLQQGYNLLQQGYTKDAQSYLNEAKRYFPSDFIEQVALAKSKEQSRLTQQYEAQAKQRQEQTTQELAQAIKTDFAEFLSDLGENSGKAEALQAFCNTGAISSKEDMQIFMNIYNKIVDTAKTSAIKEYEAQKAIDATKQSAQIESGSINVPQAEDIPTYEQIKNMSQEEYDAAVNKYGFAKLLQAK